MSEQTSTNANPWFGISMALIGVLAGGVLAFAFGGLRICGPGSAAQVAAVPQPTAPVVPEQAPPPPPPAEDVPPITDDDHIKGNKKATISLIEYSDFECPFCQRHHPTMQQALDEYGDDVNWVYRHYPLQFHPNAGISAEGSECAAELGGDDAFWAFSDAVIATGAERSKLVGYATNAGLDEAAFQECLDSGKYTQNVADEMAAGSAAGVRGTPGTFVLNNKTGEARYISGAVPYATFKTTIDELLGS